MHQWLQASEAWPHGHHHNLCTVNILRHVFSNRPLSCVYSAGPDRPLAALPHWTDPDFCSVDTANGMVSLFVVWLSMARTLIRCARAAGSRQIKVFTATENNTEEWRDTQTPGHWLIGHSTPLHHSIPPPIRWHPHHASPLIAPFLSLQPRFFDFMSWC